VELIGGEIVKHILHNQNYGSKGTSHKVKSRYACVLGYMVDGGKWLMVDGVEVVIRG
jgi:hypothetical protein